MKTFKMPKPLSVVGLASLSLLIGCGSTGSPAAQAPAGTVSATEQVTVDIFNIQVETREHLENLVARYEYLNPHVNIRVQTIGGGADTGAALQARFAANEAPTIWMLGGLAAVEQWQDHLLDISQTQAAQRAITGTLDGATLNGVQMGIPVNIEGFGWLYNTDIFARAGIDSASIQSFDDFEAAVRQLDAMRGELGIDAVFGFSGGEYWVWGQYSSHFFAYAYDNDIFAAANDDTINWNGGDVWMQRYTDLVAEFSFNPIITVDYSMAIEDLFVNHRVAMTHQGNWVVPTLNGIDPDFANNYLSILPFFVQDNGTTGTIAAGPSWFWGINATKDQAVIDAAIDFLNWMYTDPEPMSSLINDFGWIPAHYGNDPGLIATPVSRRIYEMLEEGMVTPWIHNSQPAGFASNNLSPEFQRYVAGQASWSEFLGAIQTAWEQARR